MARTNVRRTAPTTSAKRSTEIEYRGSLIVQTTSGIGIAFNGNAQQLRRARSEEHAKELIDEFVKTHTPAEPEGPFGPMMKNPPPSCKYKKSDKEGLWVDNVTCAFTCMDTSCKAYQLLVSGSKKRIKLQSTEPVQSECPRCKSTVKVVNIDGDKTFTCGTVGFRLSGEFEFKCEPPKRRTRNEESGRVSGGRRTRR